MSRRLLLPLLLLVAGTGLLYNLYQQSRVAPRHVESGEPRYVLHDVTWTRFDDTGSPSLSGNADQVSYYADEHATATKIEVTTLRGSTRGWQAQAPWADMPAHKKLIQLMDGVRVDGRWPDNGEALRIDTPSLWVDPDAHALYTDTPVTLDSTHRAGTAVGLRADWLTQNVTLYNDVRMRYDAPKR